MVAEVTTTICCFSWSDNVVKVLIVFWGAMFMQEKCDGAVRSKVVYICVNTAKKIKEQRCNIALSLGPISRGDYRKQDLLYKMQLHSDLIIKT